MPSKELPIRPRRPNVDYLSDNNRMEFLQKESRYLRNGTPDNKGSYASMNWEDYKDAIYNNYGRKETYDNTPLPTKYPASVTSLKKSLVIPRSIPENISTNSTVKNNTAVKVPNNPIRKNESLVKSASAPPYNKTVEVTKPALPLESPQALQDFINNNFPKTVSTKTTRENKIEKVINGLTLSQAIAKLQTFKRKPTPSYRYTPYDQYIANHPEVRNKDKKTIKREFKGTSFLTPDESGYLKTLEARFKNKDLTSAQFDELSKYDNLKRFNLNKELQLVKYNTEVDKLIKMYRN